ncbi:hypothetical protein [Ktedonospora formicarum]|uniref:Uncharacterized protein n=1 Tax=Ktedonospora formicarum TaxID=2778364 RepID=A0A8J3MU84_9CHLR|nr:hypothetical protein [Ktedonospora formicarum]GHO45155.1 hypothetical protein KSX_33180 [Ktedonospora formicarum]
MYTQQLVALLLKNLEDISLEERIDLSTAIKILKPEDKHFLSFVIEGCSLREAGRHSGFPGHTERRYQRICRQVSTFLNGGD